MGRKSTFTAAQKRDAVMGVLTKRNTVSQTCRELGISETTFARWREQALEGMGAALADKDSRNSREDLLAKQLAQAEPVESVLRLVPPVLATDWKTMPLGPDAAATGRGSRWRHHSAPAARYRKVTARLLLGWSFTLRCRSKDISPSLEMAWATAFPYGRDEDEDQVTVRHANGTQFTSTHYRDVAKTLDLTLSRTAYRHPDGNAFIERMFRTLKEEAVWPNEFDSHDQALAAIVAWIEDYNTERPHASLGERTPVEARAEAAQHKTAA